MSLAVYRRKRDFKRTPEPRGAAKARAKSPGLSFFIQKHAASHLHYDVRLELDGVLLSWAVPKGPCLDPSQRRLAVHVEDHPLEYGSFEGDIPKGEYGGGHVQLWERGTWFPEGDPRAGYKKGHLKFRLEGLKLRGGWHLVKMHGPRFTGKEWLLTKADDDQARPLSEGDILIERPESVAGKTRPARAHGRARAKPSPRATALPQIVEPQLATLMARVPSGDGWIHEIKFDGYRILSSAAGGRVRMTSRGGNDWTSRFEGIATALGALEASDALLDGEVVVLDDKGRSDFQRLQNALSEEDGGAPVYFVFDLLQLNGRDLRSLPLLERKKLLKALLTKSARASKDFGARVLYADHVDGRGDELLKSTCALGLEGVISKRKDGAYLGGRSGQWLKIKCLHEQEFVIAGFTEPAGSRSSFGALLLGVQEKDGLRYVGRVGTGFSRATLGEIYEKLHALESKKPPFAKLPAGAAGRGVHWVRPSLVAEVAFGEWTKEGILRHPSFKGLREDKDAADVVREKPERRPPEARSIAGEARVAGVRVTHPDRPLFPAQGITKRAVAEYYALAAERMLPFVADRPLAILRCPEGPSKGCFYQKHAGGTFPEDVLSVLVTEKDGTRKNYIRITDAKGLISLVQVGALEIHPWGSRVRSLERPDLMVFDLDPAPDVGWASVVSAAREIRDRLKALKLVGFLKTTGGKGLHVVVPLKPENEWPVVKAFSKAFAEAMSLDAPKRFTAHLSKSSRGGRIFVDYLRNERGSTAVAPYSTRAREGATVSAPLSWDELTPALKPGRFNVLTMARRLAEPDPWKAYEKSRRSLPLPH